MAVARCRGNDRVYKHSLEVWQLARCGQQACHVRGGIEGPFHAIDDNSVDEADALGITAGDHNARQNGVLDVIFAGPYQHIAKRCWRAIRPFPLAGNLGEQIEGDRRFAGALLPSENMQLPASQPAGPRP